MFRRAIARTALVTAVAISLAEGTPVAAHADPPAKGKAHAADKKKGKPGKAKGKAAPVVITPRAPASAETPGAPPVKVALDVHRVTLANGLRVVVNVDHAAPTVAVAVVYDVGSRDEERGRSGFAHLFEHMMFQGSRNVARGDHFKLIAGHGGEPNGATSADRTIYFEVLPENELALGLWLEADRMRSLDVSQSSFENQRKVVEEEYRMRVSNAAYQPSRVRREELVYQGFWPYEHSTIGSMADLDHAELAWVQAFHASHYGPDRAVLSIAGDVDADEAIALARRSFEEIPKVSAPAFVAPALPDQTGERTARVDDEHAHSPGVFLGWAIPAARTPDHDALELCADILGGGESSRFHQILVRDRSLAAAAAASTQRRRGPDMFQIDAVLATGAQLAEVERIIEREVDALATRGPTDAELARSKKRIEAAHVLDLQSNLSRARKLGEHELFFGDARLLAGEAERYGAVTRDDIKRVAAKYLGPTRRTVVETHAPNETEQKAGPKVDVKARPEGDTKSDAKHVSAPGSHGADAKKGSKSKKAKKP